MVTSQPTLIDPPNPSLHRSVDGTATASGSVVGAFAILDALCQGRAGKRLSALAREVGIPKTSALRILGTLCKLGVVRHDETTHLYWAGPRLLDYSRAHLGIAPDMISAFYQVATPVNAALNETMQLAILTGTEVTFLARLDSSRAVRLVTQVGRRLPAHTTAAGKAILAFSPPAVVREVVTPGLVRLTDRTVTEPAAFLSLLEQVRINGYASEVEESTTDLSCFAAAVFGAEGQVCAGLTVCIPTADIAPDRAQRLIATAQDTAHRISALLAPSPRGTVHD